MKRKHILGRASGITLLALLSLFANQYFTNSDNGKQEVHNHNSNTMEVHFIDVGQGDSILIEIDDSAMLIDAGENNQGNTVVKYLQSQDIDRLDYVIGTHP
ncbi:MAG TPA: MBL fold metallo-hydrolase, partial [Lachnospiraceae bacterium]|nr:MBL fold metallo-hydrolase [Lachnospiraceae bacterium]